MKPHYTLIFVASILLAGALTSGCMRAIHNKPNFSHSPKDSDNLYRTKINQGETLYSKGDTKESYS